MKKCLRCGEETYRGRLRYMKGRPYWCCRCCGFNWRYKYRTILYSKAREDVMCGAWGIVPEGCLAVFDYGKEL